MLVVVNRTSTPRQNFHDLEIGDVFYNTENSALGYYGDDDVWCSEYIENIYKTVTKVNATLIVEE